MFPLILSAVSSFALGGAGFQMEDRSVAVQDAEPEQNSESFTCCVCLDLLYKPVVLSCGHISCFWCVRQSMNASGESQCPICRQPYLHFPSICLLLHFLLLKMYPDSYKRREKLTLEEEERMETFSPQFDALACRSGDEEKEKLSGSSQSWMMCLGPNSSMDTGSSRNGEPRASKVQSQPVAGNGPSSPKQDLKRKRVMPVEEDNSHLVGSDKSCKQITVSDVLCAECKQLLFHPIALNCGHVYCESCIVNPADEKIKCQVCQSRHPGGLSKICLELDHFLEQQFPEEYALRRSAAQNDSPKSRNSGGEIGNSGGDKQQKDSSWSTDTAMTHLGFGCDYCGMYPITGDRYRCQDCVEKIGFDLCGDCYNSRCKLPGRFNQQHRPEHKFKLIERTTSQHEMFSLVMGHLYDSSTAFFLSSDSSEDGVPLTAPTSRSDAQEDGEISLDLEDDADAQEDGENSFDLEDDVGSEHQNDSQSNSN